MLVKTDQALGSNPAVGDILTTKLDKNIASHLQLSLPISSASYISPLPPSRLLPVHPQLAAKKKKPLPISASSS